MAGRRNRRRRQCAKAEDSSADVSSSGGSRLRPQPEEEEIACWTQSDTRTMRRRLLDILHRYYLDAISRLPPTELRTTLARCLLIGGHCLGPLHPVHNIIFNSLWYAAACPLGAPVHTGSETEDNEEEVQAAVLSTDGIVRICHRSLDGLLASLRHCCPFLSTGDALWQLFSSGADLASAIALAKGTSKSVGLRVMSKHGLAAFHLGAQSAGHPDPTTFAQFASSVLPAVNAKHNIVQYLMKHGLSSEDTYHLSSLLVAALPNEPPPILSLQVLDNIASQNKQFKKSGKQVLNVVKMALQEHYL